MGDISINNMLAARSAILERNVALRNIASASSPVDIQSSLGRTSFESAMNAALQKSQGAAGSSSTYGVSSLAQVATSSQPSFVSTLNAELQKVSQLDEEDGAAAEAYERGETTDIAKVMLAGQRSSIAFEATLQVRNKLLSAYKDIMSMQI